MEDKSVQCSSIKVAAETHEFVVEDDISNSQDLFLSDNEPSYLSQSQRQFDPDYIASESQSAQGSQPSINAHEGINTRVLVFEEQLKQLLLHFLKCGSLIVQEDMRELKNYGSQLT